MGTKLNKNDIFLAGEYVILRALKEDDVHTSNWYGWFNNEETTKFTQHHYFPNTSFSQLEFFKNLKRDETKIQLGIVKKRGSRLIGIISFQEINYKNRNASLAILIGEPEAKRLIYAQEAVRLMIEHGFFTLNLHKIHIGYLEPLEAWGNFLKKRFGFKEEGIWREHVFKNGKYVTVHNIGLLKDEYKKKKKRQRDR